MSVLYWEIKKVIKNRIIIVIYVVTVFIVGIEIQWVYLNNSGEANISIVSQKAYEQYLQEMDTQASYLLLTSDKASYTYKNVKSIKDKYDDLGKVIVEKNNYERINLFFDNSIADVMCILLIFILSCSLFIVERENGVLQFLRTTYYGKRKIIYMKIIGECLGVAFLVFSYWGMSAVLIVSSYKRDVLQCSLQSVNGFMSSAWHLTVGQAIFIYLLLKLMVYICVALVMAYLCVRQKTVIQTLVAIVAGVFVEYILWETIGINDRMSIFREINIFSFLDTKHYLAKYYNINIMEIPVSHWICCLVGCSILVVLCVRGVLKGYEKERDDGNVCFIREKDRGKKKRIIIWSIHKAECYKLFVAERGWLICIVFIISAVLVSHWDTYSVTMGEYYYRYYAQMFEGNITEKTLERIEQEQKYIEQEEDVMMHDEKLNALNRVKNEMIESKENGHAFVYQTPWEYYLGDLSRRTDCIIGGMMVIFIALITCGIGAVEQESNMKEMLITSHVREKKIFREKVKIEIAITLAGYLVIAGIHIKKIQGVFGISGANYALDALDTVYAVIPKVVAENVSLMQTVLLKYSLIAIGLAIITIVASAISYKISNRAMAVVLNMILFGLPVLGANVTALLI